MPPGATANQLSFDLFSTTGLATGFTLDAGGMSRPAPRAAFLRAAWLGAVCLRAVCLRAGWFGAG